MAGLTTAWSLGWDNSSGPIEGTAHFRVWLVSAALLLCLSGCGRDANPTYGLYRIDVADDHKRRIASFDSDNENSELNRDTCRAAATALNEYEKPPFQYRCEMEIGGFGG